ncbi:DUF5808 domain-containing protein [uncultured Clostridium sp.]|uniref:DUF5808 domain-containing protein n=1 Tax=uncultured Clostridium sp. TaxID=59620 RepID=UPI002603B61E|nr:DUF5808 domain-containing protein [uncultured Clostridium sp.]
MNYEILVIIGTMIILLFLNDYLPRAGKKGLLFGAVVEEDNKDKEPFSGLIKSYRISNLISWIIFLSITVVSGILNNELIQTIGIIGYLIVNFIIVARFNKQVKEIKKTYVVDRKPVSIIPLENYKINSCRKVYYIFIGIIFIGINILGFSINYSKLPEKIPTKFNLEGVAIGFSNKSIGTIILLLSITIILILTYIFADVLLYKVMFKIDPKNKEDSYKANLKSKKMLSIMLGCTMIPIMVTTTLMNFIVLQILSTDIFKLIWFIQIVTLIGAIGSTIMVIKERNNYTIKDKNVTFKDDDDCWKWGIIYYNKNNPSLFVEKRMGIGVTINAGNKIGMIIYIGIVLLILGSILIPFIVQYI